MKPIYNYAEIGRRVGVSRQYVRCCLIGEYPMSEKLRSQLIELGVIKRRRHAKA